MKRIINYLTIALMLNQFSLLYSQTFYKGADMSYVNEIESCAGEDLYMEDGEVKDIYAILSDNNANIVRYRLWHSPTSGWSNYEDIKNAIVRAKEQNLAVILDFHYSDEWADPSTQCTPAAWLGVDTDNNNYATLADSLYNYTYYVLNDLKASGLTPEFVQIGNETNGGMCYPNCTVEWPNPWEKETLLYNAGISACRAVDSDIKIILHQADPDVTAWWVSELYTYNVTDFDVVGVSFYPCYHDDDIESFQSTMETIISTYNKEVMVVETSAPWTDSYNDDQTNVSNCVPDRYVDNYGNSPTPEICSQWCIDLAEAIYESGGIGLVYWGGEWIATGIDGCPSYGTSGGSSWENQAMFDFDNNLLTTGPINFMQLNFGDEEDEEASISVSAVSGDGYVALSWQTENISIRNIQIYRDTDSDPSGRSRIAILGSDETSYTDADVNNGTTYYYWVKIVDTDLETYNSDAVSATPGSTSSSYATDKTPVESTLSENEEISDNSVFIYPNPITDIINIKAESGVAKIFDALGNEIYQRILTSDNTEIDISEFPDGVFIIFVENANGIFKQAIIKK